MLVFGPPHTTVRSIQMGLRGDMGALLPTITTDAGLREYIIINTKEKYAQVTQSTTSGSGRRGRLGNGPVCRSCGEHTAPWPTTIGMTRHRNTSTASAIRAG